MTLHTPKIKHLDSTSRTHELNQINLHAAVPVPYAAVRDSLPACAVATVSQRRLVRSAAPLEIGSWLELGREEGTGAGRAHESLNVLLVGKVE